MKNTIFYESEDENALHACFFDPDGTRGEKHEVIAEALLQMHLTDPSNILMIGDRHHDVQGALRHGIACAGVLWGFGDQNELKEAGAAYLCRSVAELKALLLQ